MLKGHQVESKEFAILAVLRDTGWTYEEYLSQPSWIIQAIQIAIVSEAKQSKVKK